jgi:hypothetical protein
VSCWGKVAGALRRGGEAAEAEPEERLAMGAGGWGRRRGQGVRGRVPSMGLN